MLAKHPQSRERGRDAALGLPFPDADGGTRSDARRRSHRARHFRRLGFVPRPRNPALLCRSPPSATIGSPQVKAYASVGYWPKSRIRGQFYVRLSKARAPGRELRLTIGSRRFILTGNGAHGWASDQRMDAAIVAAMRSAPSMSVESGTATGGAIADTYRVRGAATAIDAAALGCAKLR